MGEVQCVPKGSELLYKDSKRIRKFVLYSRKISLNIQKCFLTLENSFISFQLCPIYDIKTVEKKLKEFSRVRKHLEIFGNILSEYNT